MIRMTRLLDWLNTDMELQKQNYKSEENIFNSFTKYELPMAVSKSICR